MAIYTTLEEVRISTGTQDNSNISDAYIESKIDMADGIINGKIGDVYNLPLVSVPNILKAIALNLASSLVYIDQFGNETEGTGIDGQKLFDSTMDTLDLIWKQQVKLRDSEGNELTRRNFLQPTGYPNATTTADGTTSRSFTKEKVF